MAEVALLRRAALILVLAAAVGQPARADHIGVLQLNDRVGPYVVRAVSEPDPPRTDRCRITVAVLQPGSARPAPDAVASVAATRAGGGTAKVSIAPDRSRDPEQVYYVADLEFPSPGRWIVTVRVSGPAGTGSTEFPLDVQSAPWRAGPWVAGLGGAVVAVVVVWLVRGRRRRA